MKINKYHPMGDIYLFKMLILLIKMHIYVLNQKSKDILKIASPAACPNCIIVLERRQLVY